MKTRNPDDASPALVLPPGRLERVVQSVAKAYRKAHVTTEEFPVLPEARSRPPGAATPSQSGKTRLPEILTPEELARVLEQAYGERPRYGLIVRTLFETGLRVSELVNVQVTDVDFLERTIRVRQGKGGKDRIVLFTQDLGQQLRLHLGDRTRGHLFETNRAGRFTARRVQQIVKAVARKAGIDKHIHPHSYRHSMATFLRNQSVPLDIVQLLLGHADPRTTQLYTRLSISTARIAYDQAMAALAGRKSSGELTERHEPPTRGLEGGAIT